MSFLIGKEWTTRLSLKRRRRIKSAIFRSEISLEEFDIITPASSESGIEHEDRIADAIYSVTSSRAGYYQAGSTILPGGDIPSDESGERRKSFDRTLRRLRRQIMTSIEADYHNRRD